jgi:hypothetical protein
MIFETTTKTQIGRHRFAFKVDSQNGTALPFAFLAANHFQPTFAF